MIKKYIDFIKENNEDLGVPSHFVELNSIGHYLDTNSGEIYAMLKNGGYENEPYDVEDDIENLSEYDKKLVDSFKISIEELVKDKINLDLIDDIIDRYISEGLLDEDVYIDIKVVFRPDYKSISDTYVNTKFVLYNIYKDEIDGKKEIVYKFNKLFKKDFVIYDDIFRSLKKDDISYDCFFKCKMDYEEELNSKVKFIESVIHQDYPDEECNFSKW
jgi:hypothetical protein